MRMGVREVANVVFKPLTSVDIGNQHFDAGQPVLYIDTAKTSNLEGAATTVYATGGRGNPRLIGWDGEKTLTVTIEDALISPESFAMLSGAGIVKGSDDANGKKIYVHTVYDLVVEKDTVTSGGDDPVVTTTLYAKLPKEVRDADNIVATKEAPVYATALDSAGAPKAFLSAISKTEMKKGTGNQTFSTATAMTFDAKGKLNVGAEDDIYFIIGMPGVDGSSATYTDPGINYVQAGDTVRIDCYTVHGAGAQELEISADEFAGYYYIEADTLFREEATGQDLPAQFVIPRGKIQSNFTFTMANSGDPSEQQMRMAA